MEFKPFTNKLVAVINKNLEIGRAMNALAHLAVGLGGSAPVRDELRLRDYIDADDGKHPQISDIPFIILQGGSGQIRNLRKAAIENNLHFTDFTNTMIQDTYIEQHEKTRNTKEQDFDYFGICLFGDWKVVSELTKKFSVLK